MRALVPPEDAARLSREIDHAFEARAAQPSGAQARDGYYEEFAPDPPFPSLDPKRSVLPFTGGLFMADSPALTFELISTFRRAGLRGLLTDYLGESPVLSADKCTLRRVEATRLMEATRRARAEPSQGAWHQDGAFMGDVRSLNVWLALSRCGDDAPGLDIVPRRLHDTVPTGTDDAALDWCVSRTMVEQVAGDAGICRPIFEPGDALLFDHLFLHQTALNERMSKPRYAVESWFFGPSGFPAEYAPLAL